MAKIVKWACDICKTQVSESEYKERKIDVIFHTSEDDGAPLNTPHRSSYLLGMCPSCYDKYMAGSEVHAVGAQGHNKYSLR